MADKKYYWLKLKKDFFKRHDIRIIESMTNGKDYILFYLKLLVESIDHNGNLRFSDTIPYNEEMLGIITYTNPDIVKSALKIFLELKLISILDDKTLYMNEVQKALGHESYWAEKKRESRPAVCQEKLLTEQKKIAPAVNGEFEKFWNLYDKKVGKPNTIKQWNKLKQSEIDAITRHLPEYVKNTEKRFRKDPERYIKHRVWEDEVISASWNKPLNYQEYLNLDMSEKKYYEINQHDKLWYKK